ncbi:ATP-binding protein [Streptomyces sp. TP-A0874]|uniref:ATP-binding protein n=1 Tax=Streptomyces sp. TP-A0874 TaxID=549819 RepID=UPI000853EC92|nr:ATP-binding protein [Streptomyces sp. TP-A0874]
MDPNNPGPDDSGHESDEGAVGAPGESGADRSGGSEQRPVRAVRLNAGEFLLTVNPVDGSEIEPCPPGERPPQPERRSPEQREARQRAARPALPTAGRPVQPLLTGRDEERARLVQLLSRGRSVRLSGRPGVGRSSLLDVVAEECAGLAPDGVIRLSGHRRTPADLLYELFAVVHHAPLYRPDHGELTELLREVGAVVVIDDVEFGGGALDELLDAAPECAFLVAATSDVPPPAAASYLEEMHLSGLPRAPSLDLLQGLVGRPLTEAETEWAAGVWREAEGLPLRLVQAAALLRQRDARGGSAGPEALETDPLPGPEESAAPAARLASGLGATAREALRFAVALGGECPDQAHLPALAGDTRAEASLGELLASGLISPVGTHYRLAPGVLEQLERAGYADGAVGRAHIAAQHYAWWAGHPSVSPERTAAEADAILAAAATLLGGRGESGNPSAAVLLARTAAPAFAAGCLWSAWERVLRHGQEAARLAGEVAEEAYFHHELGVLALCTGNLERARAELEASIGLRGVLADKRGAVAGRRALALVGDKAAGLVHGARVGGGGEPPEPDPEAWAASPPDGIPTAVLPWETDEAVTVVNQSAAPVGEEPAKPSDHQPGNGRLAFLRGARRNMVAVGTGVVLAAVLGAVVTLGTVYDDDEEPPGRVGSEQSADAENGDDDGVVGEPSRTSESEPGPSGSASGGTEPSESPSASESSGETEEPTDSGSPSDSKPTKSGKPGDSGGPGGGGEKPTDKPSEPTDEPSEPTDEPSDPGEEPTSPPPTSSPSGSTSMSATEPAPSSSGTGSNTPPSPSASASREPSHRTEGASTGAPTTGGTSTAGTSSRPGGTASGTPSDARGTAPTASGGAVG